MSALAEDFRQAAATRGELIPLGDVPLELEAG